MSCFVFLKKLRGYSIYSFVCGLGGKDCGDEKLQRISVIEGGARMGVDFGETLDDFVYFLLFVHKSIIT